jgi:hypothetical protein
MMAANAPDVEQAAPASEDGVALTALFFAADSNNTSDFCHTYYLFGLLDTENSKQKFSRLRSSTHS